MSTKEQVSEQREQKILANQRQRGTMMAAKQRKDAVFQKKKKLYNYKKGYLRPNGKAHVVNLALALEKDNFQFENTGEQIFSKSYKK